MTEPAAPLRPRHTGALALGDLIPPAGGQTPISGVSADSRRVLPGDLYVALPGLTTHGARFSDAAIAAGAAAILTDADGAELLGGSPAVPVVVVADPRGELARLASEVYGRPSEELLMLGITGTAGKTSTVYLLEAGLAAAGLAVGTIGTIGFRLRGEALPAVRSTVTTPESPDLQALLAVMRERGAQAVAMEVSSHALALHRVDAIAFDVAGFTNLGHDHLDFHRDQESYYRAKAALFLGGRARRAVINTDDPWGRRLTGELRAEGRATVVTTGGPEADYRIVAHRVQDDGSSRVRMAAPSGEAEFTLGLVGRFNLANALTAAAMIDQAGVELDAALAGFATASIPGRMERVPLPGVTPNVVVDFAHTPEEVAAALAALPEARTLVVLGCGGDRDAAKRGPMGAAAARGAQVVVVTDDNPRSEDPALIRQAVLAGAHAEAETTGALVLDGGDRRSAIRTALAQAAPGDWVAILGKGHESGQEIAGVITPFDDVAVVGEAWASLHATIGAGPDKAPSGEEPSHG
ncbi:MAG: UDP-N-acetylmuramoyl-L-alanyl-D-glutamate--2,6-diaminopimelate ligase [Actinobacteria bacterium]|nr:UDP-N-acetylmuramoyl-L-alanyl-D-glutamate--2,6-diaminopimelate ligase [Actinomycetota bacterium]